MDVKSFKIGANEYKLQPMAPDVAIDFCTDVAVTLAPVLSSIELGDDGAHGELIMQLIPNIGKIDSEKIKPLFKKVREYMILPNGLLAADAYQYHEWYQKHPQELMTSHLKAMFTLLKDFFPQELGTILGVLSSSKG